MRSDYSKNGSSDSGRSTAPNKGCAALCCLAMICVFSIDLSAQSDPEDEATTDTASDPQEFSGEQFAPEDVDNADRWGWPDEEAFYTRWNQFDERVSSASVTVGKFVFVPDESARLSCPTSEMAADSVITLVAEYDGEATVHPVRTTEEQPEWLFEMFGPAKTLPVVTGVDDAGSGQPLEYEHPCGTAQIDADQLSPDRPIQPQVRADIVYVDTLLKSGEPVFDTCDGTANSNEDVDTGRLHRLLTDAGEEFEHVVDELLEQKPSTDEWVWHRVLSLADARGDDELARRIHRTYGALHNGCNYSAFDHYVEVCERLGDLNCMLRLAVNHSHLRMGEHFGRDRLDRKRYDVDPLVNILENTPIDIRRFLRGLLFRYADGPELHAHVPAWRPGVLVGRHFDEYLDMLFDLAGDEQLDHVNRRAATQALYMATRKDDGSSHDDRRERLFDASIPVSARIWLRAVEEVMEK